MTIGDRIKQRRLELDLTVDDLADRLGKNRATIYRYENGDIKNMPTTVLEPIAKALNTTPAYLMGWDDSSGKNNIYFEITEKSLSYSPDILDCVTGTLDCFLDDNPDALGTNKELYDFANQKLEDPNIPLKTKVYILQQIIDLIFIDSESNSLNVKFKDNPTISLETIENLNMGEDLPHTIAAHFDGNEYTEDELEEIKQFAEFVKNRRK